VLAGGESVGVADAGKGWADIVNASCFRRRCGSCLTGNPSSVSPIEIVKGGSQVQARVTGVDLTAFLDFQDVCPCPTPNFRARTFHRVRPANLLPLFSWVLVDNECILSSF